MDYKCLIYFKVQKQQKGGNGGGKPANSTKNSILRIQWGFFTTIVRTLKEDQPLRLLLNLLFYHFNPSEPTYKSHSTKLLDIIAVCNQLNVNALN